MASTRPNSAGMLPSGRSGSSGGGKPLMGFSIKGVPELQAKLHAMGKGGKLSSVLRSAVRAGMNPVKKDAESNVTRSPGGSAKYHRAYRGHWSFKRASGAEIWLQPGYASRHILIKTFASKDKSAAKAIVGPDKFAFYASAFLEFGVPSRGYSPQPWLKPALRANLQVSTDAAATKIEKRLIQLAKAKGVPA